MYIQSEDHNAIVDSILGMDIRPQDLMVLLVAESKYLDLQALIARLNQEGIAFVGGIFPGVIHNKTLHKRGVVAKKLQSVSAPVIMTGRNYLGQFAK